MSDALLKTYAKIQTVDHAPINVSVSGDTTIVTGISGKKIVVLSFLVLCGGATTLTWKSGASDDITGGMPFAANGGAAPDSIWGLFETAAGENLILNSSATVAVGGSVTYSVIS